MRDLQPVITEDDPWPEGVKIYARGSTKRFGRATGRTSLCRLEGCGGLRISTIWPDGKNTRPCTKGLLRFRDGWRIG